MSTLHIMIIGWIDTKLAKIKETFLLHESHKSSRECLVSIIRIEVIFLCRVLIHTVGESVDVHFSLFCVVNNDRSDVLTNFENAIPFINTKQLFILTKRQKYRKKVRQEIQK
jgi:hypothetical protein